MFYALLAPPHRPWPLLSVLAAPGATGLALPGGDFAVPDESFVWRGETADPVGLLLHVCTNNILLEFGYGGTDRRPARIAAIVVADVLLAGSAGVSIRLLAEHPSAGRQGAAGVCKPLTRDGRYCVRPARKLTALPTFFPKEIAR